VDFNPIDIDLDDDHISVCETGREMHVQVARPHGPHYADIVYDRRVAP
jgi:hypothetical protein